ncbi:MAG: hypothetical protein NTY19_09680, partial [Planctomycetota bacterium]|nr:hypothetical protein [Planctomycetota bacterium]
LGTELATIPAQVPYLSADPQLVGDWQDRLREIPGFRVGINWQGRPGPGRGHVRNIPLRHFAPLAELPGVRLISLQQRPRCQAGEEDQEPFPLIDFGDDVDQTHGALMDTAAIMRNLDLVVTSDTSVAHLAGGLGVPVWVALPWAADWRWLRARSDSPWYPTMRLFRQPRWGDWASVFRDMEAILRDVTVAARCSCQPCSP